MLRAYNAEADNCVRSLRNGNISTAKKRLENAMESIQKLGVTMEMRVNPDYHQLRVKELELTADYQMKVQEEKERAREERDLLREQRKAEQELAPNVSAWRRRTTRVHLNSSAPKATTPQQTNSQAASRRSWKPSKPTTTAPRTSAPATST